MPDPLDALSDADLEALSALLDGDLPPDQAAALRARLRDEPALAAGYRAIEGLPGALATLPQEASPPRALDAAVITARAPAPTRRPARTLGVALAALAAGALLGVGLRPGPATVTLGAGAHTLDGALQVRAAGVPIRLDGQATITVEPIPADAREAGRTPPPDPEVAHPLAQPLPLLAGAAAGAIVTLAVQHGEATVQTDDGAALTVRAGQTARVGDPRPAAATAAPPATEPGHPAASADSLTLPEARARIADLEDEVATLRLERDLQRGALEQSEGVPQEWPPGVATALREPGFRDALTGALAQHPDVELLGVNCDEYPCIALLRSGGDPSEWTRGLHEGMSAQMADAGVEDAGVGVWVNQTDGADGDEPVVFAGIALVNPAYEGDDNHRRTDWRVETWTRQAVDDLTSGE